VDSGVRHQVGLELGDVHVQGTVETEGGGQGRDDLGDQSVEVGVGRSLDVQVASANVLDGFVVQDDCDISVFQEGVGGEHAVVGLDHSSGDLRGRLDGEAELRLFAVIDAESLQQKRAQAGASASSHGVEDKETLETSALISQLSDSVQNQVHDLFADRVVASGEVVGGVLFAGDELLWVLELSVGAGPDLVDDRRLQVDLDGSGHVLASTSLREEGVESVITTADGLVRGHLSVRLDTVLQALQFPAGVTCLDSSLSNVD